MDTGDIIVFRNKKFITSLYSALMFNLDNHVGIIIKINNKDYLCDLRVNGANMKPMGWFKNKEY